MSCSRATSEYLSTWYTVQVVVLLQVRFSSWRLTVRPSKRTSASSSMDARCTWTSGCIVQRASSPLRDATRVTTCSGASQKLRQNTTSKGIQKLSVGMLKTQHGAVVQGLCTDQYQVHICVCPQQLIPDDKEKRFPQTKIYNNLRLVWGLYIAAPK